VGHWVRSVKNDIIDIHIHVQPWWHLKPSVQQTMAHGRKNYDELVRLMREPELLLQLLDAAGVDKAGLINYVSPDLMGFTEEVNDFVAEYARAAPERLIPFGSVHPRLTPKPGEEVDRLVEVLGIRFLKIHPPHQLVYPNEYRSGLGPLERVYQRAQMHGCAIMFHTGTSIFPGARNIYGDPIYCDDVAVDFPELKIILAHGGRPLWMETAFFLVRRHRNMFMDISGIPPQRLLEYFPRLEAIADKVLWGTDWPGPGVPDVAGNVEKFRQLPLGDKAKQKILRHNAQRLLEAVGG
jgi:predicted TIM-barrel fold metal-dependent hydrolase